MAEKVKLSKDGSSIDFVQSENVPTSLKKFRQSPEIEGFYRFIFENDLQKEAYDILDRIIMGRKAKKSQARKEAKEALAQQVALTEEKIVVKAKKPVQTPVTAKAKAEKPAKMAVKSAPKPKASVKSPAKSKPMAKPHKKK